MIDVATPGNNHWSVPVVIICIDLQYHKHWFFYLVLQTPPYSSANQLMQPLQSILPMSGGGRHESKKTQGFYDLRS